MARIDGTVGNDVLIGTAGNDEIFGLEGSDQIEGLDGDDLLDGGAGNDTIIDGAGSDTVYGREGSDDIIASPGAGNDVYDGGTGAAGEIDFVLYTGALAGMIVDLSLSADQARSRQAGDASGTGIDQLLNIEGVSGSEFADILIGNAANNALIGRAGADQLTGGDGDDLLNGGDGDDILDGGSGNDRASYASASGGVTVSLLRSGAQNTGQGTDTLSGIENLTGGRYGDILTGSDANNSLSGGAGDDRLFGRGGDDELIPGLGIDRMYGGTGNDTYYVSDRTHYAYEYVGEGTDLVFASVNHTLRANVENLILTGNDNLYGRGNALANVMEGNGGNNKLYGLEGDDTLYGGGGSDILDGGVGVDRLFGGTGDDTYTITDAQDYTFEKADEGTDRVFVSFTYSLRAHVENLYLTGTADIRGTGNDLENLLVGNAGFNVLSGLDGNDRLLGGGGDDYLSGGEGADTLDGGAGRDRFLGGIGSDTFLFRDGDFAGSLGLADRIIDFSRLEGDRIHLAAVDADVSAAGDQAFTFINTNAFTGVSGELRYEQISGNTYLQGDTNGDGVADIWVRLDGLQVLTASDLVL